MVIIFPGGPPREQVETYTDQFVDIVAGRMSLSPAAVNGHYFTDYPAALDFLKGHPDAFIISSLGFYLSRREVLHLIPLASVEMSAGSGGRYYLMVKKGTAGALDDMKGKTIAGSTLFEDPVFLKKVVFGGKLDPRSDLTLDPTSRPLSAIRKAARGELGGVLLDDVQYNSLKALPLFEELAVIYESPRLPEVGLMMVDTSANRNMKEKLLHALTTLGETEAGAEVFSSFGMKGFSRIDPDSLDEVIRQYDETD
ncbi:MAG: PhnD/SsuA/transferrin family substrate-binding protein [PVC group bacterium]